MSNPFHIEQTPKGTCICVGPAHYIFWIEATAAKYFVNHSPSSLHVFELFAKQREGQNSILTHFYIKCRNIKKIRLGNSWI